MHLFIKWLKYAFAYAHMQMHNYPKPSDNINRMIAIDYYQQIICSKWAPNGI
jgi:hypothetical protein